MILVTRIKNFPLVGGKITFDFIGTEIKDILFGHVENHSKHILIKRTSPKKKKWRMRDNIVFPPNDDLISTKIDF